MKAVVLAAGEGRRLYPFTDDRPKVMLPIANRPIMEYVIEALAANNIRDIVVVTGYKEETVRNYFGDGRAWKVNLTYVTQEKQIGTGHALLQAASSIDGPFLALAGDNIVDAQSLSALIDSQQDTAVLIEESSSPSKYGVVQLRQGRITAIVEKPPQAETNLISTGIYRFQPSIFSRIEDLLQEGKPHLTDVVCQQAQDGEQVGAATGTGTWMDVVYPWDMLQVNAQALRAAAPRRAGTLEDPVTIRGNVRIGDHTVIRSGSYIVGPAVIGEGCEIGPHVCIFPGTSIGDNVVIYPYTDVRFSVVMAGVTIGSHTHVSHSVIGAGTAMGSHFTARHGTGFMEVENVLHTVGDAGVFIGDDCTVDDQVTVEPAVAIGHRSHLGSGAVVRKTLPPESNVM